MALAVVAVLIIGGLAGYHFLKNDDSKSANQPTATTEPQDPINLNPSTADDAARVDENKQKIVEDQTKTDTTVVNQDGKKAVTPVITYSGQYGQSVEVGAYANTLETSGTCSATFTLGTKSITKTVQSVRGASSMDCPVMATTVSELGQAGTWSVSVKYDSATSSGTSETKKIEVK